MMKTAYFFWKLLNIGLSKNHNEDMDYQPITEKMWHEIYLIGKVQGVLGILFSAIEHLPKNHRPPLKLLMEWYAQTVNISTFNSSYREKAREIIDIWASKGIQTVVLKGMVCAEYYPEPDRRALGDLDIFLLEDNESPYMGGHLWAYDEGNRLAAKCGATVDIHDYKHSHILYKGLMVENHKFLTTCRGAKAKKEYERYLQSIIPSIQFEALFLMTHAYQHFMEEELSIRQICDWAMFMKAHQNDIIWEDFYHWMDKLKMRKFADAMNYIISVNLSVTSNNEYSTQNVKHLSELLLQDVFEDKRINTKNDNLLLYRIRQAMKFYNDAWKYRIFRDENAIMAYINKTWNHWFDEI